ncbi:MAG TPA: TonB-dependent receptor, partial [bacterium]|nr:TonB-dependent receptor [bacterium]
NPEGQSKTPDIGQVSQGSDYNGIINGDLIVKYVKDLSPTFNLNVLAGGNYYQAQARSELTTVTNLIIPSVYNLSNTASPPVTGDATVLQRRLGAYAQATLGFKDQLFLTGTVRNDWSSTLPINSNSIFYPGANLSWVASQLVGAKSAISFLKFRAAYGKTGSDPAPYLVKNSLGSGIVTMPFGEMNVPFNGIGGYGVSNTINNGALKPIITNEAEVGMEARFLKDRVGFDVSLYNKNTKGQIFPVFIAPSTGYTNYVENLGTVNNKGIELTFNARPVETRNFTWTFTYIFAKNLNKVVSLQGSQNPLLNFVYNIEMRAVVGKSVASIYGPVPVTTPKGQIVVDPNTTMPVTNTAALDAYGDTKGYYGSALYDYTMGLTNTFTYKSFSLTGTLDFR